MGRRMQGLVSLVVAVLVVGSGCAGRLTPERVQELLEEPKGTISNETMAFVTRDLFVAQEGTALETFAQNIRSTGADNESESSSGGEARTAGPLDAVGDAFCVGGLVAGAASFDACALGEECNAELTVDSCLLRVGADGADEDARGKLKFRLANTVDADFERSELGIEFEGWESSRSTDELTAIAGQLAVETARSSDDGHLELTVAVDVEMDVKRKERGLFDDGLEQHASLAAGVRFVAHQSDDSAGGTLEVLASASENGDDEASVTLRFEAESRQVDANTATANAEVSVVGENGTFTCTWTGSETRGTRDGLVVTSAGSCTDPDGETFSFEGEAAAR